MDTPISRLQEFLDDALQAKTHIRVLEAGCGSASHFHFKQTTRITGIDISEKQLQVNLSLDEKILGDIQYYDFKPSNFDLIVCWDVLEHLPMPELALGKFVRALKEDGFIVLKLPNLLSLKGVLTKYLPYRLHVWYYRYLYGKKSAGSNGTAPFKTYLKKTISASALRSFAVQNELAVAYYRTYDVSEIPYFLRKGRVALLARKLYITLNILARLVSFGSLGDSELIIVLCK